MNIQNRNRLRYREETDGCQMERGLRSWAKMVKGGERDKVTDMMESQITEGLMDKRFWIITKLDEKPTVLSR